MSNFENQVGSVYIMPVNAKKDSNPNMYWHMYSLYGTPSKASEYTNKKISKGYKPNTLNSTETYKHLRDKTYVISNELHHKSKELLNRLWK